MGGNDVNEAFLVTEASAAGCNPFSRRTSSTSWTRIRRLPRNRRRPKASLAPGEKRAKKAAKKAKKKKSLSDTVNSFGATKQQNQIKGNVLYTFRDGRLGCQPVLAERPAPEQPGYSQSRIGAAAGGPLPRSPQTIFFLSFAALRGDAPYANFDTVPTAEQRGGNFSKPTVAGPLVLYDPISHLPLAGNIVPASRMDKIAGQLLNYIPLPNLPVASRITRSPRRCPSIPPISRPNSTITLNDKNRFSLSFALQSRTESRPNSTASKTSWMGSAGNPEAGWTHNFGPRAINAFHWAFSRNRSNYVPYFANGPNVGGRHGHSGNFADPLNYGPPNLSFTNFGNMTDGTPLVKRDQASALRDAVTVVRGVHSLTFGGEYRRMQSNPSRILTAAASSCSAAC